MRGHDQLIAMRRRGFVPAGVWIDTNPDAQQQAPSDWHEFDNGKAHLQTEPGDRINRLDLRCVFGLPCYIDGPTAKDVHAMRDACIAAGASRVIAWVMVRKGIGEWVTFDAIEASDTAGVFNWTADTKEFLHG